VTWYRPFRLRQIRPFFDVDSGNKKIGGNRFEPSTLGYKKEPYYGLAR
jgi:hypothetical protein